MNKKETESFTVTLFRPETQLETDDFLTWPFDYNQVFNLLIGLIFSFIALIITILFIF